jgi:hypothetical protein
VLQAVHSKTRLDTTLVDSEFRELFKLLSGPEGPEPALGTTLGRLSK